MFSFKFGNNPTEIILSKKIYLLYETNCNNKNKLKKFPIKNKENSYLPLCYP